MNKTQRVFFCTNERSIIQTQIKYRQHFNVGVSPSVNMIRELNPRFERSGSIGDLLGRGSKAMVEAVQQSVLEDPSTSTRRKNITSEHYETRL